MVVVAYSIRRPNEPAALLFLLKNTGNSNSDSLILQSDDFKHNSFLFVVGLNLFVVTSVLQECDISIIHYAYQEGEEGSEKIKLGKDFLQFRTDTGEILEGNIQDLVDGDNFQNIRKQDLNEKLHGEKLKGL